MKNIQRADGSETDLTAESRGGGAPSVKTIIRN